MTLFRHKATTPVPASVSPSRVNAAWRTLRHREQWRLHSDNPAFSTSLGSQHESANRYSDVQPYNETLVKVEPYVHASWISDISGRRWIAAQGPMSETVEAFWSMLFNLPEDDAPRLIVQLTAVSLHCVMSSDLHSSSKPGERSALATSHGTRIDL